MHFMPVKIDVGGAAGNNKSPLHPLKGMYKCSQVLVQASPDNTATIVLGNEENLPFQLPPGASIVFGADDPAYVYVNSTVANQRVNWGME